MNIDILLNDDNELIFSDGDFVVGPSDSQHIANLLEAFPGNYKQHPLIGVGIGKMLNGSDVLIKGEVKKQLGNVGYKVKSINLINGELNIDVE